MTQVTAAVNGGEPFELEIPIKGEIPERVIEHLIGARAVAKDYVEAYADAVKAQAEKYKIKPGALKRYIAARAGDKLKEAEDENDDLAILLGKAAAT